MLGFLTLLAVGLATFWLILTAWTAWQLTHPPRKTYGWAVARSLPGDPGEMRVSIDPDRPAIDRIEFSDERMRVAPGVDLAVWDFAAGSRAGPIVIVSHGWGDSRIVSMARTAALWPCASRLVMYDSRGHGESSGTCALGTREVDDLLRVIESVRDRQRDASIVLCGHSLGAGVSIAAAGRDGRIAAVIAEAPYRVPRTPARNVLASRALPYTANLPPALALIGLRYAGTPAWAFQGDANGFDRAAHAGRLPKTTPLLLLHGSLDEICPFDDSRAIAQAAGATLCEISGGTHTTLWTDPATGPQATESVRRFISGATLAPRTAPA